MQIFKPREMIILAVIIALLVLIALPNFFEARVRSKKSKNYAPMRFLATAVEAYYNDHNAYPPMKPLRDFAQNEKELRKAGGWDLTTIGISLTTPTAYMQEIVTDPFSTQALPFVYFRDGKGWMFLSRGPDGDYDMDPAKMYNGSLSQPSRELLTSPTTYDPTNGTISSGDVWRVKQ